MDIILYYIRDNLVSVHYFIYAFICLFLMFAIIGYLFKQKYAKVTININSSQPKKEVKENNYNQVNNQPTNVNTLTNLNSVNQNQVNNQVKEIPEVKPIQSLNNQIEPTINSNNSQVNPVNLNNQGK